MKEIDDDALEECFFRIAVGETLSVVANKFGLTTSGVARRVSKMLRILNHPDNCLEDEPQPYLRYPDYGMGIPEWIREKRDIYLARLKRRRASRSLGVDTPIPTDWVVPLGQASYVEPRWTPELDALLGTVSDPTLAKQLNCSSATVRNRRLTLKINPFDAPKWSPPAPRDHKSRA